jgi:putative glutamine amidotransferase
MPDPVRVGLASCFFHSDPKRPIFKGKTLLYMEESLAHWLMAGGAVPLLLPTPAGSLLPKDLLRSVDALVLQGGTDVAPFFGGSLFQDITSQCPGSLVHRDFERYDQLQHDITLEPDSWLAGAYPGRTTARVNTVHHQAIKERGRGLRVE